MDFCIRLAYLEDIPTLTTLISESARVLQSGYYSSEQIEGALGIVFGVDSQLIQDKHTLWLRIITRLLVVVVGVSAKRFMEVIQAK